MRTNITVIEDDGATTKLNEPGQPLAPQDMQALVGAVLEASSVGQSIDWGGSLPAGFHEPMLADAITALPRCRAPRRARHVRRSAAARALRTGRPAAAPSRNAIQLRGGDFDGSGAGVEDLLVLRAFDGPVAGAVAFDHSGVGAVPAFAERESKDLLDDTPVSVIGLVRGENPRSHRLRGG